jgi:hypothetical protein
MRTVYLEILKFRDLLEDLGMDGMLIKNISYENRMIMWAELK